MAVACIASCSTTAMQSGIRFAVVSESVLKRLDADRCSYRDRHAPRQRLPKLQAEETPPSQRC